MRLNSEQIDQKIQAFLQQCKLDHAIEGLSTTADRFNKLDAGVLVLFQKHRQWQLVLTKKADYLNRHAGQIAFPGGKFDSIDGNMLNTALRETEEEIGIVTSLIKPFHQLEPQMSRHNIKVYPFLALLDDTANHYPNCTEVTHSFNVPIEFFVNNYAQYQEVESGMAAPCWQYDGFKIWGLTAAIIVIIIKRIFDVENIPIFDFRPVTI